ncbi:hypothetical protein FEF34_40015 [Streptomyces marianii]|uniref:Uncharacterized protein n=1 Tax=Streptomyces marianii TaxID=1817406 RepID=A0A5R9DW54_9ACTN|nr:hypothetical protein FEF34_40015 [Streptomyces marianii]
MTKRRKNLAPPVLTTTKRKKKRGGKGKKGEDGAKPEATKVDLTKKPKPDPGSGSMPKVDLTKKPKPDMGGTGPKIDLTRNPKSGPGRKKARVKSKKSGSPAGTGPSARRKARRKERARRAGERAKAKATTTEDTTAGPGADWAFWEPPPRGERRNAYDSMRTTDPNEQVVWTAEPVFPAGYHAPAREPLTTGARSLPAGSTSTTITKEAPVGNAPAVTTPMAAGMSPEHVTEVTLDDVIDFLDEVVSEAFDTHDECVLLAAKAKDLMYALDELAAVLAGKHNIIGTLTALAMQKLAESMELLSRKAEEMQTESLNAAETCEVAKTSMDDAYRPLTQATADAGLRTPSARIHNEN